MLKKSIIGFIIISLLICSCKNKDSEKPFVVQVISETFENKIEISGNIEAAEEQKITASSDGVIEEVYFKEGDVIKKGEILCSMDNLEQQYNIANLQYQIAIKRLTAPPREVSLLQMQLKVKQKELEKKKSIARFDGVVAKLSVAAGDYREAGQELATIIDRSYLKAVVEVAETDASKLQLNQKVSLKFPSYPKVLEGYVSYFPAIGKITSRGSSVVEAEIRLDNPPAEILTGFSFTGHIEITAPVTLILADKFSVYEEDGKAFADKQLADGTIEKVEVKYSNYKNGKISILSGLEAGDLIVCKNPPAISGSLKGERKSVEGNSAKKNNQMNVLGIPGMNGPKR